MKTIATLILICSCFRLLGHEEVKYKIAEGSKIGESNAFELTKTKDAIIKTKGGGYLVLRLLKTGYKETSEGYTESCSISWTLIDNDSVSSEREDIFITYKREAIEGKNNSFKVEAIDGSDKLEVAGVSIRWSRGTGILVYLYPEVGMEYATIKVEQVADDQLPARAESKAE